MICRFDNIPEEIIEEVVGLRREIHRHPEMGNREFRTAELIENYLQEHGIKTQRVLNTAVIGLIEGEKPGRTVAFRADIDALPVSEATGVEYASQYGGVMHACGHDVHTAALLGAARLLVEKKAELCGKIILIFQPDNTGVRQTPCVHQVASFFFS